MTPALTTIARGDGSLIADAHRAIVRDAAAWHALWAAHAGPSAAAPAVDFDAVVVAAAFAGERPSAGFQIEISPHPGDGAHRLLDIVERGPAPGTMSAQMIVTPFHIVSLPRDGGDVAFTDAAIDAPDWRPAVAAPGPSRSARVPAASSTGLDPNVAAALAYLAGPFSGAVILFAERTSEYVTFHAWQSIAGLGGLGVLALGLLVAAFAGLILSPLLFTLLYRLSALAAALWLVAWAVSIGMAASGREWRMPIAGGVAEKWARRRL